MSDVKIGDRVRVTFVGAVDSRLSGRSVRVVAETGENFAWVRTEWCELLPDPIKVGDLVSGSRANVELPEGSVVARDGEQPLTRRFGGWTEGVRDTQPDSLAGWFDFAVLRVGWSS